MMHGSDRVVDQWSKGTLLTPSGIQRKVMLFPDPDNLSDPSKYILIDF